MAPSEIEDPNPAIEAPESKADTSNSTCPYADKTDDRASEQSFAATARQDDSGQKVHKALKIIIAIHGIGDQLRSSTVRTVARQFAEIHKPRLALMPLGYFDVPDAAHVEVHKLDVPKAETDSKTKYDYDCLRFGEVYWADFPRSVVKEADRLEDSKEWGLSIVSRAHATYEARVQQDPQLEESDFQMAGGVVEEIVESVRVMQKLLFFTERAGIFKFDLAAVLRDYVGDVQLVAEFKRDRERILFRFHQVMQRIVSTRGCEDCEIYLVAHSEGTVISFLALLQALSNFSVRDPEGKARTVPTYWVNRVRGFMTFGSPIDKHILLWPQMWPNEQTTYRALSKPIEWRNYYDFGDPIGFKLDETRARITDKCNAFNFKDKHDYPFARYTLPGVAHSGYWRDKKVFKHFIDAVVFPKSDAKGDPPGPKSRILPQRLGPVVPYLVSFALHCVAIYMLLKALTVEKPSPGGWTTMCLSVAGFAALLMGATAAARMPRLVKSRRVWLNVSLEALSDAFSGWWTHPVKVSREAWREWRSQGDAARRRTNEFSIAKAHFVSRIRWFGVALACFAAGVAVFWVALPEGVAEFLSVPIRNIGWPDALSGFDPGKSCLVLSAFVIMSSGWLAPRSPRWGRRVLVGIGMAIVAAIVVVRLGGESKLEWWKVLPAGAIFVYAWWLAILVFDLSFIWTRYVRNSVALDALRAWERGEDMKTGAQATRQKPTDSPRSGNPESTSRHSVQTD